MRIRPLLLALPALAALALGLWALRAAPEEPGLEVALDHSRPRPQGDLWVGAYPEPSHLNPFTTQDAVARRAVLAYTHDALLELDPASGGLRPALATAVESSADGLEHTLTIRSGVRFADGSSLTVDDVLFLWQVAQDPSVPLGAVGGALRQIAAMQALPEGRVRLSLRERSALGLGEILCGYRVVCRAWVQDALARRNGGARVMQGEPGFGELLARLDEPGPGTGPYWLAPGAWRKGQDLTLLQNPHSWRRAERPLAWNLAGLRLRFLADRAAQLVALRRGELDWLADPDPEGLLRHDARLAARFRALDYDHLGLGHYVVVWNHRRPLLGDARVRRALGALFDRRALADGLLHGHATVARSWWKPGDPRLPADLPEPVHDPAVARALLAEAGASALRVRLTFAAGEELHQRIVALAEPAFARAGVALVPEGVDGATLVARLGARDFDAVLAVVNLDPWSDPSWYFGSAEAERGRNWMGYRGEAADRLLAAARQELDQGRRVALYRELAWVLYQDEPLTLLVHPRAAVLVDRRYRGAEPGMLGLVPELWWVEASERRY